MSTRGDEDRGGDGDIMEAVDAWAGSILMMTGWYGDPPASELSFLDLLPV
jgi:hypothetical protein